MNEMLNRDDELELALQELDNLSSDGQSEKGSSWEDDDDTVDDDEKEDIPKPKTDVLEKADIIPVKITERSNVTVDEYTKLQVKEYQRQLFNRTSLLEEMRKSYLRDVVVLKNLMKVCDRTLAPVLRCFFSSRSIEIE